MSTDLRIRPWIRDPEVRIRILPAPVRIRRDPWWILRILADGAAGSYYVILILLLGSVPLGIWNWLLAGSFVPMIWILGRIAQLLMEK